MTFNEFMKANGLKLLFSTNGAPWRDLVLYARLTNEDGALVKSRNRTICGEGASEQQAIESLTAQIAGKSINLTIKIKVPKDLE